MFRRTDCHFYVLGTDFDQKQDRYKPHMTSLLNAVNGKVYLDVERPRVCIREREIEQQHDLGYAWSSLEDVFPFFEIRAAPQDLRSGAQFSRSECLKRIEAQLDTLRLAGKRLAVLNAFGCGNSLHPPAIVAECYAEALRAREQDFDCVAFAISYPGYGDNHATIFKEVFAKFGVNSFKFTHP